MSLFKKITAAVLLFFTVFPLLFSLFFLGQQKFIRWQMEEKLEHDELVSITISESDFQWHKKDKEIIYKGHYFDVKSITELSGHKLLVTGLYDYQEQELNESIAKMLDTKSNSRTLKLIQQLFSLVVTEPVYNCFAPFPRQVIPSREEFYDPSLRYCYLPIIIRPPKVV